MDPETVTKHTWDAHRLRRQTRMAAARAAPVNPAAAEITPEDEEHTSPTTELKTLKVSSAKQPKASFSSSRPTKPMRYVRPHITAESSGCRGSNNHHKSANGGESEDEEHTDTESEDEMEYGYAAPRVQPLAADDTNWHVHSEAAIAAAAARTRPDKVPNMEVEDISDEDRALHVKSHFALSSPV